MLWRHAEVNKKTCRESELTLAGEGLRGDCSMVCFLEGVPSTAPFWSLASMVVDCCCPGGCCLLVVGSLSQKVGRLEG